MKIGYLAIPINHITDILCTFCGQHDRQCNRLGALCRWLDFNWMLDKISDDTIVHPHIGIVVATCDEVAK